MSSFSDRCQHEDEQDRLALVHATIGRFSASRHTAAVREEREADLSATRIRSAFHLVASELMAWTDPPTPHHYN